MSAKKSMQAVLPDRGREEGHGRKRRRETPGAKESKAKLPRTDGAANASSLRTVHKPAQVDGEKSGPLLVVPCRETSAACTGKGGGSSAVEEIRPPSPAPVSKGKRSASRAHPVSKERRSASPYCEGKQEGDKGDKGPRGDPRFHNLRVLNTDDNPANRKLLARMLHRLGVPTTHQCENGLEAVQYSADYPVDVAFIDLQMPVMGGTECVASIVKRGGDVPYLVAITADATPGVKERCIAAGYDMFMSKPCTLGQLKEVLEHTVGDPPNQPPLAPESSKWAEKKAGAT